MISTNRLRQLHRRRSTVTRASVSRTVADRKFGRIAADGREFPNYPAMAVWYCAEVVAGRVPACKYEVQACERLLEMRRQALAGEAEFVWSDEHLIDVCDFIEKLPHVKAFTGTITLEPVQCFWLAGIFAFRERETGLRWTRSASLWVPRKNGKTSLSVGVVLYCANFEGEPGAEVVISAGSEEQANIPYGLIRKTLEKDEEDKDNRFDERVLEKLNPLWNVSLYPAAIDEEIFEARKSESKLQEFLRTRLNIWTRAAGSLISVEKWGACADRRLNLD